MKKNIPTKKYYAISVILFAIFAATTGSADNKIQINFDDANPPFMYEKNGQAHGIYPELVRTAFSRMRTSVELSGIPWGRALVEADEGTSGIGGFYKTKEREEKYDLSDPLYVEKINIYTLTDKAFAFETFDDLKGKTIGVIRSWSYGDGFDTAKKERKFKTEESNSDEFNIKKLAANRIEAMVGSHESVSPILKRYNLEERIKPLKKPITLNETFVAFKKTAQKSDLIKKFNATIAAMKADGSYEKIKDDEIKAGSDQR